MKNLYVCLFITLSVLSSIEISAQTVTGKITGGDQTVTGKITGGDTNEPLIGAIVRSKQSGQGAASDIDGNYTVKLSVAKHTLEYGLIGYTNMTKEVILTEGQTITLNVLLVEDTKLSDEVIVVGYGVQRKREVTGAISKIDGKELTKNRRQRTYKISNP